MVQLRATTSYLRSVGRSRITITVIESSDVGATKCTVFMLSLMLARFINSQSCIIKMANADCSRAKRGGIGRLVPPPCQSVDDF